jgi:hypothetical protein
MFVRTFNATAESTPRGQPHASGVFPVYYHCQPSGIFPVIAGSRPLFSACYFATGSPRSHDVFSWSQAVATRGYATKATRLLVAARPAPLAPGE